MTTTTAEQFSADSSTKTRAVSGRTLYRLSGAALIGSCILSLAGGMAHPVIDGQAHSVAALTAAASPWAQLSLYVGALLLMLGLPGMYLWVRPGVGVLGLIGIGLYFVSNATSAQSHLIVEAFVGPTIAANPATAFLVPDDDSIFAANSFATLQVVAGLIFILSLLIMGIALVRARAVPRWIGIVLGCRRRHQSDSDPAASGADRGAVGTPPWSRGGRHRLVDDQPGRPPSRLTRRWSGSDQPGSTATGCCLDQQTSVDGAEDLRNCRSRQRIPAAAPQPAPAP